MCTIGDVVRYGSMTSRASTVMTSSILVEIGGNKGRVPAVATFSEWVGMK